MPHRMPTDWRYNLAFSRYSRRTKWDQIHSMLSCQSSMPVTPQEAALYIICLATPRVGTSLLSSSSTDRGNYSRQYRRNMTQKWISRRQSGLITVCSDSSRSASGLSTRSRTTFPPGVPRSVFGSMPGLQQKIKSTWRFTDTNEWC